MATPRINGAFTLPAAFDEVRFVTDINAQLDARATLFRSIAAGLDESGVRRVSLDAGFVNAIERDTLFEWIRARLALLGGPTGAVSVHLCSHAAGESPEQWENCRIGANSAYTEASS